VLKAGGGAERLVGAFVTDEFFRVLPEPAALGRTLGPADADPGAPAAVVLSWGLWRRRFGGDSAVLGRSITLGDRASTVVGVMPAGFGYPTWAAFWAPIGAIIATDPALGQRGVHVDSRIVGRLRPGVDSATGQRSLSLVAARLAEAHPAESGGWRSAVLMPVATEILGGSGEQLRLLTAAAALVLLIGCVNVAALALARTGSRSRELANSAALGGGPGTLLRLLAAECVVLGAAGGAAGLALAIFLIGWIRTAGRDLLPRAEVVALDPGMLLGAVALSIAIVVALGLLPVLRRSGPLTAALREGTRSSGGIGRRRLRAALVVGEVALALVLLTGAGLLVRSLVRLQQVPTGLDTDRLLAVPISPPSPRYDAPERALQLYRDVAAAVAAVPGVQSVSLTNHIPLSGASMNSAIEVDGTAPDESDEVLFREVDSAYFRVAGIPIVRGRDFLPEEIDHPGDAALVNQATVARYWPGDDPIGKRITVYKSAQGRPDFGDDHRRVSLVYRLGPRHLHFVAWPLPRDRSLGDGVAGHRFLCCARVRRHGAEPLPRWR
jgi:putative ABC transport system permease protein